MSQPSGPALATLESRGLRVATGSSARNRQAEFARHAIIHTLANLGTLACSGALAFVLPRFLTVDDYGYYRLFLLYGGFAGVLHLGFLDGLLIRWAARPWSRLKNELATSLAFLWIEELVMLGLVIVGAAVLTNRTLLLLTLAIGLYSVLWNWSALGQYAIQALKLFEYVSFFTILAPLLTLLSALALYPLGQLTLRNLILTCLLSQFISAGILWMFVRRRVLDSHFHLGAFWPLGRYHVRLGWSVVCANLLAMVALSLDRLVLSRGFSIRDFAIYSFAANALALTYNMILSVARVLFPYLSEGISAEARVRAYAAGEIAVLLIWAGGLASFFPIAWLIPRWLPNYIPSIALVRILMLATGLTASIHILHSTYFRVMRKQNRFLVGAFVGAVSAALLIAIGARTGQLSHFAWAMVGSALAWWLVNEFLLRDLLQHNAARIFKALGLSAACAAVFLFCANLPNLGLGLLSYSLWAVALFIVVGRPVLRQVKLPGLRFLFIAPSGHGLN